MIYDQEKVVENKTSIDKKIPCVIILFVFLMNGIYINKGPIFTILRTEEEWFMFKRKL